MLGFKGIWNRKPRSFGYLPRYYDPVVEAKNKRRIELGLEPTDMKERKPGDLIRAKKELRGDQFDRESDQRSKRNIRLVFIVLGLLLLGGWLIWSMLS